MSSARVRRDLTAVPPPPPSPPPAPPAPPSHRGRWIALAVVVVVLAAGVGIALALAGSDSDRQQGQAAPSTAPASPGPTAPPSGGAVPAVQCPAPTVTVHDADELGDALAAAGPGTVIAVTDGVYADRFTLENVQGSQAAPVFLCGSPRAVIDGGGPDSGYGLHLDTVSWVRVVGLTVRNAQKGVVADHTQHSIFSGLTVTGTGDEGIHLRAGSSDNVVAGSTVSSTGHHKPKFGEGIYVGSAESNWCTYSDCGPDRSDRNTVTGNTVTGTTAESVDIKEGTTGGVLSDNTFDGAAITAADSWVDVKGNGWQVTGNRGTASPGDGFQTHEILDGWGRDNRFSANTAAVDGPGYGIAVHPDDAGNVVACDNTASGARNGLSNTSCQG